ncbi:MAG: MBL fold metallo-hydrolase [Lachnospiraceae bacterium]|nr:MBL fold metallo-hydrolase [Lachnospiraceae bacterium]
MRITFVGAAHEVTGSCHYLEVGRKHILVDYGMEQGINIYENVPLPVDASVIDYVLLTHAHIDHSGLLPLLYAKGFRGEIYATKATVDLCSIMLRDSAHIQMSEAEWRNRKAKRSSDVGEYVPLYNMEDADGAIRCLVPVQYGEKVEICEELSIRFTDVGHLLGSAAIEAWLTEEGTTKKVVFSGDIGNDNQPLIRNFNTIDEADYILCESTYGDRLHVKGRVDYAGELANIIRETFSKGGNVVIPSFAVGRTQEILYYIRQIKEKHLLDDLGEFPVYVDSPLAVEATGVFNKNVSECFSDNALELVKRGINPLVFPGLNLSITSDESKAINFDTEPKVIISASGMCEAGRIRHHLKHNLWREECTILFVGYQAVGTLGRSIIEGAKEVKLFGEPIEIRASIVKLEGVSGHADKAGLTRWMLGFKNDPQMVFIVHGDDTVTDDFAAYLHDEHGFNTYAPFSGTCYDLIKDELVEETVGIRIEGAKKKTRAASTVFERLLAAGQRLLAVISHNEGGANKDLAKFADQINSLCDKWDR